MNGKTRSYGINSTYVALNKPFGRVTADKFSIILPRISLVNISHTRQFKNVI